MHAQEEEDILTEGSEVERPVIMGEGTSEIGSERRYATRQSTRKQHSQASTAEPDRVSTPPTHSVVTHITDGWQCWQSC